MNKQTCQVLYAKYNSTRRPQFRVTTEVCEDAAGLFVRKRAAEPAAEAHLKQIRANGDCLQDYYKDIRVIPSDWEGGALRFPYVRGETLSDQIDPHHFNREAFVAQVSRAMDAVLAVRDAYVQPFESTPEFEALFGPVDVGGAPALNPANIDSLLTNFIENEDGVSCIDCEWVCRFPVPVEYIRYRILRYLYLNQVQSQLEGASLEEMIGWFGFSNDALARCWEMEKRYQQYIHGEDWKYIYTSRHEKPNLSLDGLQRKIAGLEQQVSDKERHIRNLDVHIRNLNTHIHNLEEQYQVISNAFFWRITKPARAFTDWAKRVVARNESVHLFFKLVKDTLRHGPRYAVRQRKTYLRNQSGAQSVVVWPTEEERAQQRAEAFPKDVTISVLVPLYNTPKNFLREMIDSVREQTYAKWELCLADGSDAEHGDVAQYCREAARQDGRIKYRKLDENGGISANTNACIDMATGDYFALFDHDDVLHPCALYEVMKAICGEDADFIYTDECTFHEKPTDVYWPHCKPDFAPDTLRSYNYICHLTAFSRTLLDAVGGGFRKQFDGSQDYDLILRLTERARHIVHIRKVLYFWRGHAGSTGSDIAAKSYTVDAAMGALAEHLRRVGLRGTVEPSAVPSTYRVRYAIEGAPLVSIVIPNKDHVDDLKKCVDSIAEVSTWKRWEIIVVENNSTEAATFDYYKALEARPGIRVVKWEGGFNFPAICNLGAREARGDYILLLNNDVQVITPDWLEQMLMFAQRGDVGAVGAMLYYPDDTIQHAGVILGIGGVAGHSHKYFARGDYGYASRLTIAQDLSAVTAACCLIPRRVWEQVGGLDEAFAVAFNDVDLCMRIRRAGYLIVWTPYAELYHFESKSRGVEDTPEKVARFNREATLFHERWDAALDAGDPYYSPHLSLVREDFSFR